jgi:hypothetical protein
MAYSSSYSPFVSDSEREAELNRQLNKPYEFSESPYSCRILFNNQIYHQHKKQWVNCKDDGIPTFYVTQPDGTHIFSYWGTSDDGLIKKTKPEHLQPIFERFRIDGKKIVIENNQTVLKPTLT